MGWLLPPLSKLLDSRCQILDLSLPINAVGITEIWRAAYKITSKYLPLFICSLVHKLSLHLCFALFVCTFCFLYLPSFCCLVNTGGSYMGLQWGSVPSSTCRVPNWDSRFGRSATRERNSMEKCLLSNHKAFQNSTNVLSTKLSVHATTLKRILIPNIYKKVAARWYLSGLEHSLTIAFQLLFYWRSISKNHWAVSVGRDT